MLEFVLWALLIVFLEELGAIYIGQYIGEKLGRIFGLLIGLYFGKTIVISVLAQISSRGFAGLLRHHLGELCRFLPFC